MKPGANTEKIMAALRVLQEEGLSFRFFPEAVEIDAGRLRVSHPGPGPCSSKGIRITIDGNEIQNMLSEFELRAAAKEAITFTVKLGGFA